MPTLPNYSSPLAAEGIRPSDMGAEAWNLEGRHVAAMLHQTGEEIGGAVNEIQAHDDLQTSIAMSQKSVELNSQLAQEYATKRSDPNFNLQDWQAHVQEVYGQLSDIDEKGTFGSILGHSDKVLANAASLQHAGLDHWTQYALSDQSQIAADRAIDAGTNIKEDAKKALLQDPAQLGSRLPLVLTQLGALYSSAKIPANKLAEEATKTRNELAGTALDSYLLQVHNGNATPEQIEALRKQVNDPNGVVYKNATSQQLFAFNMNLEKASNTKRDVQTAIFEQNAQATFDQVAMTGDPNGVVKEQIAQLKGSTPEETAILQAKNNTLYDTAQAKFSIQGAMTGVPMGGEANYLADKQAKFAAETDPQQRSVEMGQLKAAQQMFDDRAKMLTPGSKDYDPVGFTTTYDGSTKAAYQAYLNAAPQDKAKAWDRFALTSATVQARITGGQYSVVDDTVRQQANQAMNLVSTQGPTAAGASLAQMAQTYGRWWPSMAVELRQEKVLPTTVGVAAELYGNPRTQAVAETLLSAADSKAKGNLVAKNNISDEKATKAANDALVKLSKTMANIPNGDQVLSDYRSALAAMYQYTGDTDVASSAKKMLLDRYSIRDTLRIPAGIDDRRVADGADAVRSDIGSHDLVVPPSYGILSGQNVKDRYVAQLRSDARWFSNENGTGAVLYQDATGHNTVKEMKHGKPVDVELSWDELGKVADKTPMRAGAKAVAGLLDKGIQAIGGQ